MHIGVNSTSALVFNYTSALTTTLESYCQIDTITETEKDRIRNTAILIEGFQGCSYEKIARNAQSLGVNAVIFQSRYL